MAFWSTSMASSYLDFSMYASARSWYAGTHIAGPVADALTKILLVELIGFVLAAAAAVYEALT